MRIMIVDDDIEVVAMLEDTLAKGGHSPSSFGNGGLALGAIVRGKFELIILDLDLPNLGGIQLIGIVRGQFPYLPIIVISGLEADEWRPKSLEAGASRFFSKPIRLEELHEEVSVVERSRVRLNIGVIDGSPEHQETVRRGLQSLGCKVFCWPSFVDMLRDDDEKHNALSVLLVESQITGFNDVMTWAKGRNIAAVAVSDDTKEQSHESLMRAGAAFCLPRPVDAEALVVQARFFVAPDAEGF